MEQLIKGNEKLAELANKGHSSLQKLVDVAESMQEGEFFQEVEIELKGELGQLANYILKTRTALQELEPGLREGWTKIPQATFQLSTITQATEDAAHKIMSLAEKFFDDQNKKRAILADLSLLVSKLKGDHKEKLELKLKEWEKMLDQNDHELMEMMTALSFQDLTGQKIKKIMALVSDVEKKILDIMISFKIIKPDDSNELIDKKMEILKKVEDKSASGTVGQNMVNDILDNLEDEEEEEEE